MRFANATARRVPDSPGPDMARIMLPPETIQRFEQLMLPHLDAAYNLARWLLPSDEDAQDAVQSAYLRALRFFHGFQGSDGRSWLLVIVRNTCRSMLVKRKVDDPRTLVEFDERQHSRMAASSAEQRMVDEGRMTILRLCLDRLPERYREVIVLRELEEMPYREIARVTQTPTGTVMSRLARARARLQACVAAPPGQERL